MYAAPAGSFSDTHALAYDQIYCRSSSLWSVSAWRNRLQWQLETRIREFVPGGSRLDAAEVEAHVRAYHNIYAGQWCAYDDVPDFLAGVTMLNSWI